MFELIVVTGIGVLAIRRIGTILVKSEGHSSRTVDRLERLWKMTRVAMRESKFVPAEKALLTILKIDHKNAPAYNRLGIIYAKQKNYGDAIECFEIASSIDRKPSSLHNLGLIYYETEQFDKAVGAFERAIETEPMAVRYIALAKALQKLEHHGEMVKALQKAYELEPNPQTAQLLIEGYKLSGMGDEARSLQRSLRAASAAKAPAERSRRRRLE